ncbi:transposase [Variovorax ureilyticus]|uniref:Transposase n=1 Tax=Variovorax ureilyticus TaxID=1836198 RepID=A0ABU8VSF3_9BURK
MDTTVALSAGRRRRRKHSPEFKAHVVAACSKPGVSSASVAMANGINANLVRRWVRDAEVPPRGPAPLDAPKALPSAASASLTAAFVPVQLPAATGPAAPPSDIHIELRRGAMSVVVTWPVGLASECGGWLRELLR